LVRKRPIRKDPDGLKTIAIHPELHKILNHQAVERNQTLREALHTILCRAMNRPDLLGAISPAVVAR
jgi:hypothetical protein